MLMEHAQRQNFLRDQRQAPPPLESHKAPTDLPGALADLQHTGHYFQTVSCELWKVNGSKVRIKKDCSLMFSEDTVITSQDIVVGFDRLGIDIDSIVSIQRKASNNTWVVTFNLPVSKDVAVNEQSVTISGCVIFLGDCSCKSQRCFNCEQPGHRSEDCPLSPLCRVCLTNTQLRSVLLSVIVQMSFLLRSPLQVMYKLWRVKATGGNEASTSQGRGKC